MESDLQEKIKDFIAENDVDNGAAAKLRNMNAEVQGMVLDEGDLKNARNPSQLLMRRIQSAVAKLGRSKRARLSRSRSEERQKLLRSLRYRSPRRDRSCSQDSRGSSSEDDDKGPTLREEVHK